MVIVSISIDSTCCTEIDLNQAEQQRYIHDIDLLERVMAIIEIIKDEVKIAPVVEIIDTEDYPNVIIFSRKHT